MKTLYYVIKIEVPEFTTIVGMQEILAYLLRRGPTVRHHKTKVLRPRGKLGAMLREMEAK